MVCVKNFIFVAFYCNLLCFGVDGSAVNQQYNEGGGFSPSLRYYESNLPSGNSYKHRNSIESTKNRLSTAESKHDYQSNKESRFGLIFSPTGSGTTYGTGVGTPVKLDIGGIALGALIGLGAILIVPKLAHILSGEIGYRSLESGSSTINEILARVDNSLEQNNIDSTSCVQRMICNSVNDATKNQQNGEVSVMDELILTFTNNKLFTSILDGTAIKQSVNYGRNAENVDKCTALYPKCPLSKENVLKVLSTLLPA